MEATSAIYHRSIQRYAFIETLIELAVRGWRLSSRLATDLARMHSQESARRELHGLSDHSLRDIGLERGQIDRLFR